MKYAKDGKKKKSPGKPRDHQEENPTKRYKVSSHDQTFPNQYGEDADHYSQKEPYDPQENHSKRRKTSGGNQTATVQPKGTSSKSSDQTATCQSNSTSSDPYDQTFQEHDFLQSGNGVFSGIVAKRLREPNSSSPFSISIGRSGCSGTSKKSRSVLSGPSSSIGSDRHVNFDDIRALLNHVKGDKFPEGIDVSDELLNYRLPNDFEIIADRGQSIAHVMFRYKIGRVLLRKDNWALLRRIDEKGLNAAGERNKRNGYTLAHDICGLVDADRYKKEGRSFFEQLFEDDYRLLKLITPETINSQITIHKATMGDAQSLGEYLAITSARGRGLLKVNKGHLLRYINNDAIKNWVIESTDVESPSENPAVGIHISPEDLDVIQHEKPIDTNTEELIVESQKNTDPRTTDQALQALDATLDLTTLGDYALDDERTRKLNPLVVCRDNIRELYDAKLRLIMLTPYIMFHPNIKGVNPEDLKRLLKTLPPQKRVILHRETDDYMVNLLISVRPDRIIFPATLEEFSFNFEKTISDWLEKDNVDINQRHEENLTALQIAVLNKENNACLLLLRKYDAIDDLLLPYKGCRVNLLEFAILTENQEIIYELNKKLSAKLSFLLQYQISIPMLKHIKTIEVDCNDLNDDIISMINTKRKTILYDESLNPENIYKLMEAGCSLAYKTRIDVPIDDKYIGIRIPSDPQNTSASETSTSSCIEGNLVNTVVFSPLSFLLSPYEGRQQVVKFDPTEHYQLLSSSDRIEPTDRVMFVFAARGESAYLPPLPPESLQEAINASKSASQGTNRKQIASLKQSLRHPKKKRCVIVLTSNEYNNLKISQGSQLHRLYDFLILADEDKMIIARKRAVFRFASDNGLRNFLLIDDNIKEINLKIGATDIYDFLSDAMVENKEQILCIPTYKPRNAFINTGEKIPGSKVMFMDYGKFADLLGEDAPDILLPCNMEVCCEDYLLQFFAHAFFKTSFSHGYRTLDQHEASLIRSKEKTNSCLKSGVRVWKFSRADLMDENTRKRLEKEKPEVLKKIIFAQFLFIEAVKGQIARYEGKFNRAEERNIEDIYPRQRSDTPKDDFKKTGVFKTDFANTLDILLRTQGLPKQEKPVTLRSHQIAAINFLKERLIGGDGDDVLFNMATGTGKTLIMLCISLAAFAANPDRHVIILSPFISLVEQMVNELFNKFQKLLSFFNLEKADIITICSDPYNKNNNTHLRRLLFSKKMSIKPRILVFCQRSWSGLIELSQAREDCNSPVRENAKHIFDSVYSVVVDEGHLCNRTLQNFSTRPGRTDMNFFKFTATPNNKHRVAKSTFTYTREKAIEDGILAPLIVDKSLSASKITSSKIISLLENCTHPNGDKLKAYKGILYVNSCSEASLLFKELVETGSINEENLHLITSDVKSQSTARLVDEFKEANKGLAIVVDMLKVGFDDAGVYFVINASKEHGASLTQMVGRVLRQDPGGRKVGYYITNSGDPHTTIFPHQILTKMCDKLKSGIHDLEVEYEKMKKASTYTEKGSSSAGSHLMFKLKPFIKAPRVTEQQLTAMTTVPDGRL